MKKSRKTPIIAIIIIAVVAAVYLNRAYARIFSRFDQMPQPQNIDMSFEKKDTNIKYVALGDSLTSGMGAENTGQAWPAIIAGKMTSNQTSVELTNFATPGATSGDVLREQVAEAVKLQPDLVTLLVGVNDIHNFVPLDEYRSNVRAIIDTLSTKTKAKVVVVNLPYLGTDSLMLPPYNLYFGNKTDEYNKALNEVAQDFGLTPVDIHATKRTFSADKSLYSFDEFHPSAKGYQLWANLIYDAAQ